MTDITTKSRDHPPAAKAGTLASVNRYFMTSTGVSRDTIRKYTGEQSAGAKKIYP